MITEKEKIKICYLYQNEKKTIKRIAEILNYSTYIISKILKENNVQIRDKKVNLNLKENYFETINTEEKAYLLGLFFTDGSVGGRKHNQIRIELQYSDFSLVFKIKQILNVNSEIIISQRKNKNGTISTSCLLAFNSSKMANDLKKYGIIPNKTYLTKHLPCISKNLLPHFLRGLIDGDGCIYTNKNFNKKYSKYYYKKVLYFCNYNKSVCEDFREYIKILLKEKEIPKVSAQKSGYRVTFTKKEQVKKILNLLYKNSNIYLQRKYNRAKELFE